MNVTEDEEDFLSDEERDIEIVKNRPDRNSLGDDFGDMHISESTNKNSISSEFLLGGQLQELNTDDNIETVTSALHFLPSWSGSSKNSSNNISGGCGIEMKPKYYKVLSDELNNDNAL